MKATFNRLVHMKLQEVSPDVYEECIRIATPIISEPSLTPGIVRHLVIRNNPKPETMPFVIAVTYYLIAPHKLISQSIKLASGLRTLISDNLGFENPELVNHYSKFIIPMWKNPRFKDRVIAEAEAIIEFLK
ncbi:hypothetical protein ACTHQF_06615 [Pedobacter sp. SAFR-022]|uniref:hypothetical protein n=1 Tax=Pedobacter sp. SAFR-022 TaxID=3436861 RepID=UPI003F7EA5DA